MHREFSPVGELNKILYYSSHRQVRAECNYKTRIKRGTNESQECGRYL